MNTDQLTQFLVEQIDYEPVKIVVDAFDECKCQTRFLQFLRYLIEQCGAQIFITTRPNLVHVIAVGDLRLDAQGPDEDICRFVWEQILNPKEELSEVDLSDDKSASDDENKKESPPKEKTSTTPTVTPTVGLSAAAIVNAVLSIEQFRSYYEVS